MSDQNKTKAELIEELAQLRATDTGKIIADLQDEVATLKEEAAKASNTDEVEQLKEMVQQLTAENAALVATKGNPHPLGNLDGKNYQIRGAVNYKGKKYSPKEVAENAEVLAGLVAMKSPMVELINA